MRVLIVDDDEDQSSLVGRYLSRDGFTVQTHTGGIGLSNEVRVFQPHAALLDVNMPTVSGDRLLSLVRRHAPVQTTFLLHSSEDEASLRRLARSIRADGYLTKSMPLEHIGQRLQTSSRAKPPPGATAELLDRVRKRLSQEKRWARRAPAKDAAGNACSPWSSNAVSWSLSGAVEVEAETSADYVEAMAHVAACLEPGNELIAAWEDAGATIHMKLTALLAQAFDRARQAAGKRISNRPY